jgi:hypothetical protein
VADINAAILLVGTLIDLAGMTPVGVRCASRTPRLQWRVDGEIAETDFARFQPVRLASGLRAGTLRTMWQDFGDLAMTDPFLNRTRNKTVNAADRSKPFMTDQQVLHHVAIQAGNLPFSGAVFHLGRVGSTLVHRLLSETKKVLSLSEPLIVDQSISLTKSWPIDRRSALLRDVIGASAQPRRATERHLVIKMVVVMNTELGPFNLAFPKVPWLFVYRDPVEIMVSVLRQPPAFVHYWRQYPEHAAERFGVPAMANRAMSTEEFVARVLGRFCALIIEASKMAAPGKCLTVSYRRLPDAIWETIAPHFGITLSESDREVMREQARYSAKSTDAVEFRSDSDAKRDRATPEVVRLAERYIAPMIEELKALPQA